MEVRGCGEVTEEISNWSNMTIRVMVLWVNRNDSVVFSNIQVVFNNIQSVL